MDIIDGLFKKWLEGNRESGIGSQGSRSLLISVASGIHEVFQETGEEKRLWLFGISCMGMGMGISC